MTLKYQENEHWKSLLLILDDHTEWFHALIQCLFYPENAGLLHYIKKPSSFEAWFLHANKEDGMHPEMIEKLAAVHADLFKSADILLYSSKETGVKPSYQDFQKILTIYEEFLLYIRRLEKDSIAEGSGFDSLTGLRSKSMFVDDIKRELDRLARQGKSFCIALVKIDNFDYIKNNLENEEANTYIKLVAGLVKLSIRSFDDAYYTGQDEFLLCLKQADVTGAISALERLRKELEQQGIMFKSDTGSKMLLSLSCCIAEPVSGDDVHDLIRNLRVDLKCKKDKKIDTVLEYHELSPLQRFVQEGAQEN